MTPLPPNGPPLSPACTPCPPRSKPTPWLLSALTAALLAGGAGAGLAGPALAAQTNEFADIEAAPPPGLTNSMQLLDDHYKLAIGDQLSFRILQDEDEPPKQLLVTDSGDLEVPYIGRVPAAGKTCKQLAFELKRALEKDYYYQATVILAVDQRAKSRGKVYLVGPVRNPGPQDIPSDETLTLSKAILRAGGFTDLAERHNVRIIRRSPDGAPDTRVLTVDVAQIFDKGRVQLDVPLQPGDLIVVPERLVRF
jgi:polysaccharide biosynthesis/export protein